MHRLLLHGNCPIHAEANGVDIAVLRHFDELHAYLLELAFDQLMRYQGRFVAAAGEASGWVTAGPVF
jgi:hypothetical protein